MKDPNPANNGKSIAIFKKRGIKTRVGFLEDELKKMNESFIKFITQRMPFVVAKCAQTLDGKIATASGHSKWITSGSSRDFAHDLRNDFDAILVGVNTAVADDPRLDPGRKSKRIKKVIVDSRSRISPQARLFQRTRSADIFIATTRNANKNKLTSLEKKGINILVCPQRNGWVDLRWLFKELAKREISSVLIEGGARIIGSALKDGLIDKFFFF